MPLERYGFFARCPARFLAQSQLPIAPSFTVTDGSNEDHHPAAIARFS